MSEQRRRFGPPAEEAPASAGPDVPPVDPVDWPLASDLPEAVQAARAWSDQRPASDTAEADEEPQVGFLAELIGYKRRERLAARLRKLDRAIATDPDAPVNYVLRGELRLKLRQRDEAAADFQKALALADSAFTSSDWGLVAQALSDRAVAGLRRVGYRLRSIE